MNTRRLPLLLVAAAITAVATVSACSSGSNGPKIKSFGATPANVPSLGADVLLTWDVRGADEIAIEPLVGVVTGTSASVHVTETTTFTLLAKKRGLSSRKRTTVTVAGASTVVGVVRKAVTREPAANLVVWIKGHGATYTGLDGTFAFEGVEQPYDIAVLNPSSDPVFQAAIVYLGVTRPDPNLEIDQATGPFGSASISGNLLPALPPGSQNNVIVDGPNNLPSTFPSGSSYNASGVWFETDPADFTLHALRWTVGTAGNPSGYTGYGQTAVTLENGIAEVADITLAPVTTDETTGTVTLAGSATFASLQGFVIFGNPTGSTLDEGFFLPADSTAVTGANTFSLLSPALNGGLSGANLYGKFGVTGVGGFANAYLPLTAGSSSVELDFPAPPRLLTPVNGGSVSRDTVLRAATRDDSIKIHALQPAPPNGPALIVITSANEFVVPDLREVGFDIFQSSNFAWDLYVEIAPRSSIDEAMGPDGLSGISPEWLGYTDTHTLYPTAQP